MNELSRLINRSKNTVFFGGAGVSTESGIPDFRSESGLYTVKQIYGYPPEDLLSHSFFEREPELFFRYYKENLIARDAKPNAAHIALAGMERAGKLQTVITQNIDGLHQAAGSQNVLELHGSNWRQYCVTCGANYSLDYILQHDGIPRCEKCGGIVRPDVVLYEEGLDEAVMNAAIQTISHADLLIVGGTSLSVYPAASLLRRFRGKTLVLINKTETPADSSADLVIREPIGEVLGQIRVFRIRKIAKDIPNHEAAAIAKLADEIWREHYTPLIGTEQVEYMLAKYQSPEQITADIKTNGYTYFTAEDNGKLIGYCACQPREDYLFLSKLYVYKDYRGNGMSRSFLEEAGTLCKQEPSLVKIRLTVNKHNSGAIAVYQRLGFKTVDSVRTDIGEGFVMDDYIMEL